MVISRRVYTITSVEFAEVLNVRRSALAGMLIMCISFACSPKKLALTKLMELVKSHSSKWIKAQGNLYQKFYWQDGYSAFSVSESQVESIV